MLKKVLLLSLLVGFNLIGGSPSLQFDYPLDSISTNGPSFVIYSTNNVAAPAITWPVYRVVDAGTNNAYVGVTNGIATYTIPLTTNQAGTFMFVTASNMWGQSVPSIVVQIDKLPVPPALRIR